MIVEELALSQFRCFASVCYTPARGANVIVGDNASGKSSVLEALYLLGRGQSYRQTRLSDRIRSGADRFMLRARLRDASGLGHRLTAEGFASRTEFRIDDEACTRFELVQALPLQLIDPNVHRLLEYGPKYRRRFLDWGVFHVEHAFFPAWRRYRRALRQRNRALRQRWPKADVVSWDSELVTQADTIDAARRAYVDEIEARLPDFARLLFGEQPITLTYERGWRRSDGLGPVLARSLEQDRRNGFTQSGPHRADLRVDVDRTRVRDRVSRGQQKVLTATLLLIQAQILKDRRGQPPLVLIDDLAAELGPDFRHRIAAALGDLEGQAFLTFLDHAHVPVPLAGAGRLDLDPPAARSAPDS